MLENIKNKIGNTPLVELKNIQEYFNLESRIFAKLESYNFTGSVKDRAVYYMLLDALKKGTLNQNSILVEASSGNTGISLAAFAKELNIKCKIFMPSSMSKERIDIMKSYGADVILTDKSLGMMGSILQVEKLIKSDNNAFSIKQFDNPSNVIAHYETTGPEIYQSLKDIDIFIAGVGTGGTFSGVSKYLKEQNKNIKTIIMEPENSPFLSCGKKGSHKIQGIGAGFKPSILELGDQIVRVKDEEALKYFNLFPQIEDFTIGISSAAVLASAIEIAKEKKGKNIVVIFPDDSTKYLSLNI